MNQLIALKVGEEWMDDVHEIKNAVKIHFEGNYSEPMLKCRTLDHEISLPRLTSGDNESLIVRSRWKK